MSNDELAKRAVACARWRWMPGMLAERWTGPCHGTYRYSDHDVRALRWWPNGLPVLDDPSTLGCLLALVREAWGGLDVFGLHFHSDACWCVEVNDRHFYGLTEAEALVAALEAAP